MTDRATIVFANLLHKRQLRQEAAACTPQPGSESQGAEFRGDAGTKAEELDDLSATDLPTKTQMA